MVFWSDCAQDIYIYKDINIQIYTFISIVIHLFDIEEKKRMDKILTAVLKRQIPFLIGGTITGIIMTYYYGFLFFIIVNSVIWMFISFIVNKYYWKSTGFKDERYLLQYTLSKLNSRSRRTWHKLVIHVTFLSFTFKNSLLIDVLTLTRILIGLVVSIIYH